MIKQSLCGLILPSYLVDLLEVSDSQNEEEEEEGQEDEVSDYNELLEYLDDENQLNICNCIFSKLLVAPD